MFFHNLTGEGTTTLHMHIRINQRIHPHEQARAFTLDEIIENLEKGITPRDMLLERGCIHVASTGMRKREMFKEIPGIHFSEVPNPYKVPSNFTTECSTLAQLALNDRAVSASIN